MLVATRPPTFLNSSSGIPSLSVSLESARREWRSCGGFILPCVYTELYTSGEVDTYLSYYGLVLLVNDSLLKWNLEY